MAVSDKFKFNEIIDNIVELVRWFERNNFDDKNYRIFLSNGESFMYKCNRENFPHLLGIKTDNLITSGLFKSTNAYDIMKELCASPYRIGDKIETGEILLNTLFSKHISEKLDYIKTNISMNGTDFMYVLKYRRDRAYLEGNDHRNCDYILFKRLDDGTILELDLVRKGHYCFPLSNRLYNDELEADQVFQKLLINQDMTIVSSMIYEEEFYNKRHRIYISELDKISRIQYLKNLREKYKCNIDVTGDFEYYCHRNSSNKDNRQGDIEYLVNLKKLIDKNQIIDEKRLKISYNELSSYQLDLIDSINDIQSVNGASSSHEQSYSQLQKQVASLTKLKEDLLTTIAEKQEQLDKAKTRIENLQTTNEEQKKFILSITSVVDNYKQNK